MKLLYFLLKSLVLSAIIFSKIKDHSWLTSINASRQVLEVLSNFFFFILATDLSISLLSWMYRRRKHIPPSRMDNVTVGLQNIYYLLFAGALIFTFLGLLGIDYRTLFTSLSIVAAAIAIISKDYISEIISGIIISFSNDLSIDDYVKIGNQKGKIVDLKLTKLAMLNEDDDMIFIPNNSVFSNEIINYTKVEIKKVSVEFEVNLSFLNTVEELEAELIECIKDYDNRILKGSYNLKIVEIKKDSISLKFQYILHRINRELEREIRKKTVRRVVNFIKKNSPTMAKPPQNEESTD
ncbi:MAG: hypothetical protein DHS20C18_49490 [Saprospiraceae bacterium]|nr:MAG: hypothetical protein DHS20C18_49490 [Saprospiraceae bacterium]